MKASQTSNNNFYLILGVSILAHLLMLVLLSRNTVVTIKPEPPKAVIQAQLLFMPPEPPAVVQPHQVTPPEPVEQSEALATPAPKAITAQPKVTAKTTTKPKIEKSTTATIKPPTTPFNPKASLERLVAEQNQAFFDSIPNQAQQRPSYKSINTFNPNANDQNQIKAIFETAARIDPDTRVVNYNGSCVQIKRVLDHNGFSQFSWQGTTLKCGKDDATNKQLNLSLSKFVKP
jgi:hypothetical protein